MSNRIIRDWTDSEKIESLTWKAEVFFTRLIMKADDFGRYHANPKLLKASIFPLKDIDPYEVSTLLEECEKADLLKSYQKDGRQYLQIKNFGQRLRIMRSKFPEMTQTETKTETKQVFEGVIKKASSLIDQFFLDLPNSTQLVQISKDLNIPLEKLKARIPEFRKFVETSYPTFDRFCGHFKNWIRKNGVIEGTAVGNSSIDFSKYSKDKKK